MRNGDSAASAASAWLRGELQQRAHYMNSGAFLRATNTDDGLFHLTRRVFKHVSSFRIDRAATIATPRAFRP